jgi:hypothetical protein
MAERAVLIPYLQYKNGMFLVQTLNVPRVVLSPKYIEEINRTVPDGSLDMVDGLREVSCLNRVWFRACLLNYAKRD